MSINRKIVRLSSWKSDDFLHTSIKFRTFAASIRLEKCEMYHVIRLEKCKIYTAIRSEKCTMWHLIRSEKCVKHCIIRLEKCDFSV